MNVNFVRWALFFIVLFNTAVFAQINVGPTVEVKLNAEDFKPGDLQALKGKLTYFVYKDSDANDLDRFKSEITSAWNYTPLRFISYAEYKNMSEETKKNTPTLSIWYSYRTNGSAEYLHLFLALSYGEKDYARIELYPDFATIQNICPFMTKKYKEKVAKLKASNNDPNYFSDRAYQGYYYNWNTLYLKNALQVVNSKLTQSQTVFLFNRDYNTSGLSVLAKETLYIPEHVLIKFNKFTGDESEKHDVAELFASYGFAYKVVSDKDLVSMASNADGKTIYYLSYIRSSTDKYLSVMSNKGEVLCSHYTPISYNLKDKDLEKLSLLISEKAK